MNLKIVLSLQNSGQLLILFFFDEFVVRTHEFMAYQQFIDSYYFDLELIGAANNYYFTAFKVKRN
ncbi:MAG: hypothetical protein ABJA32_01335 [Ginsengibacter sp.]|jgi:hypothetical protein